jgi:hypothetical protein
VISGPEFVTAETYETRARNLLFELNIASRLWETGLSPQLGEHPDVECEVSSVAVLVQCKRPFSRNTVGRAIADAESQLRRDLQTRTGAKGVIAVSVSKTLNPGDRQISVAGEPAWRDSLRAMVRDVADKQYGATDQLPGEIIAIWYHAIMPGLDEATSSASEISFERDTRPREPKPRSKR